jgi:hypothetical protein
VQNQQAREESRKKGLLLANLIFVLHFLLFSLLIILEKLVLSVIEAVSEESRKIWRELNVDV